MLSLVENLFKKNHLQDLLSSVNAVISTNESTRFITGHVIYNPAYTYKFHLKTTLNTEMNSLMLFKKMEKKNNRTMYSFILVQWISQNLACFQFLRLLLFLLTTFFNILYEQNWLKAKTVKSLPSKIQWPKNFTSF